VSDDAPHSRVVLSLGVTHPGRTTLAKMWKITDGGPGQPQWACYPAAVEHDGKLYIVYTAGFGRSRQCGLSIVPVASLAIGPAE
jgi:hypothetical protein